MSFWISPGAICDRSLEDNHHCPSMIPSGGLIAWGFYVALVRVPLDSHEDGEIFFCGKIVEKMMVLDFLYTHVGIHYDPRIFQHTPGTYSRPRTNSLWRNSFHLGVWGGLGYAPGVCWGSFRYEEKTFGFASGGCVFFLHHLGNIWKTSRHLVEQNTWWTQILVKSKEEEKNNKQKSTTPEV